MVRRAMLQYMQFAYGDESTRRRMSDVMTPKPGRFEEKWVKLDLAQTIMRVRVDLKEAALIVPNVRPELVATGKLLSRRRCRLWAETFGNETE